MDHWTLTLPENVSESKPAPPSTTTSSTQHNYFSHQALRAGIIADELRRNEIMMNTDPVRMAIQRELEKERIREDIIASQIFRRQELEAEVRMELAMERDLALRRGDGVSMMAMAPLPLLWSEPRMGMLDRPSGFGFGFGKFGLPERLPFPVRAEVGLPERLPFPVRNEVGLPERLPLPFQRNPEAGRMVELSKEQVGKVMHLPRPITSHLAGTKRKVTVTEHVSNSKPSARKSPQEWKCALCEVIATGEQGLYMHFQGKKHKTKEAKLNKEAAKTTNNFSLGNKKIKGSTKKEQKLEAGTKLTPGTKKRQWRYWCEDCKVGCLSENVMDQHCNGKKHMQRLKGLKLTGGTASSTTKNNNDAICETDESEKGNKDVEEKNISELAMAEMETEGQNEAIETMESLVDEVAEADASKG